MKIQRVNNSEKSFINKNNQNNKTNFKGYVDHSVVKYLDDICVACNKDASTSGFNCEAMAINIYQKLDNLLTKLHDKTTFSIRYDKVKRPIMLPFSSQVEYVDSGVSVANSVFANELTKTSFSMSDTRTVIFDGQRYTRLPAGATSIMTPQWGKSAMLAFNRHVDGLVEFFGNKEQDVDKILFFDMVKQTRLKATNSILPKWFISLQLNKRGKVADSLAEEFGVTKRYSEEFRQIAQNSTITQIHPADEKHSEVAVLP